MGGIWSWRFALVLLRLRETSAQLSDGSGKLGGEDGVGVRTSAEAGTPQSSDRRRRPPA